ncbi:hypothetical protein ACH5RR_017646 [Cinchona calisaya]|uniref:Uncharacterized protein n=1 Tax=Cinchona calisaya TaxID=153742 RepID=A0ABD2ZMZ3_9GENT
MMITFPLLSFIIMLLMLSILNKACLKTTILLNQSQSNFHQRQGPETTILLNQEAFGGSEMYRQTIYSVGNMTSKFPEKMGTGAPVEVGTRGTVGSLLKKEIEYFRRLEVDCSGSSVQPQRHVEDFTSAGSSSWPRFRFLALTWKRKKRKGGIGAGVRPGMCSMVEVSNTHRLSEIPGFRYRNLRAEMKEYEV